MVFDKDIYTKQCINVSSVRCNKQIESDLIQSQVDEFEASGGKVELIGFGVSNSVYKDLRSQHRIKKEQMNSD